MNDKYGIEKIIFNPFNASGKCKSATQTVIT